MNITKKDKLIYLEVALATFLFIFTLTYIEEPIHVTFSAIIGLILYLMIFVELIRALFDFILDDEHKFKVRYIYDMGIMFIIREILVTMSSKHHTIIEEVPFLLISAIFLVILFHLRIKDAQVFKYTDKCENCSHNFNQKH